ncbi:MAG: hypothetical protein ACI82S_002469 [Patiriisocius sp.]|jgi:hypothetical protein
MKNVAVLCLPIYKLVHILMRSLHTAGELNPYCDLVCRGFEVGYLPAETLSEISLICYRRNSNEV